MKGDNNMDNECYEGTIISNSLNEMKNRKCCCPRYIPGPTGPTGPTGPAGGPIGATGPTHPVKSVKYPNF